MEDSKWQQEQQHNKVLEQVRHSMAQEHSIFELHDVISCEQKVLDASDHNKGQQAGSKAQELHSKPVERVHSKPVEQVHNKAVALEHNKVLGLEHNK